jgi:hypothetical protein
MTTTKTMKAARVNALCDHVEHFRQRISEPLPPADLVREAIDGIINSRTGRLLRSAPSMDARPLSNVFWYVNDWHGGTGYIGTLFNCRFKCGDIVRGRGMDITGEALHDMLDTLALVLRNGNSPASDRWAKALGL